MRCFLSQAAYVLMYRYSFPSSTSGNFGKEFTEYMYSLFKLSGDGANRNAEQALHVVPKTQNVQNAFRSILNGLYVEIYKATRAYGLILGNIEDFRSPHFSSLRDSRARKRERA